MDPDRWKSVAVPIKTWDMLKELSEDNRWSNIFSHKARIHVEKESDEFY